jgi:hypothetical protein
MENCRVSHKLLSALAVATGLGLAATPAAAQDTTGVASSGLRVTRLQAEPARLDLVKGQQVPFKVVALDAQGREVTEALVRYAAPFRAIRVRGGLAMGVVPGDYTVVATVVVPAGATPATLEIPVTIRWPAVTAVKVTAQPGGLYAGTTLGHTAAARHADGTARPDARFAWSSSDPAVATVDRYGFVTGLKPGQVTVTAELEGVRGTTSYAVKGFPAAALTVAASQSTARTGDVVTLTAELKGRDGTPLTDVPVTWSYTYTPDDSIAAPGATAAIDHDKFAAEVPGIYTVLGTAGQLTSRTVIDVRPRGAVRPIQAVGRGTITHVHTSDLWPWTGKNGRDYALVGTWGGDGWGYVYDITDLGKPVKTDSIKVDARTINDVTVSPDGRYGAFSREGASNRVNGLVILDLADPAHPKVAASFDQELTGGVHNMFATSEYLFAISGGDKYVVIDVRNIYQPKYVSEYNHPNSYVHDVWVHDGIAYSSEWGTGVVAVDVGNGKYGGTIERPKLVNTYPTTSGATHEIFPYFQPKTGKVYLFLGDEVMSRQGKAWAGTNYDLMKQGGVPQTMAGYTHIIDFTDPLHPRNVARYENAEFGAHDIIVEDDVLYQAYYDGGVRVIDVSGELLGNLQEQGREIAVFKPYDPQGYTANAPMVMNAMPWKGHVLFTDFNSGLWVAKVLPKRELAP